MDIVLKISDVPTEKIMGIGDNVPSKPIIIKSITVLNAPSKPTDKIKEQTSINKEEK